MTTSLPTASRPPPLAQPWKGGVIGWILVFGAVIFELIAGIVTNQMSDGTATVVLAIPVALIAAFVIVQWFQVGRAQAEPARLWHLGGVAAAVFAWLIWPVTPPALTSVSTARDVCFMLYTATPGCVSRASEALRYSQLTWWVTGGLIVAAALLARRSRIAPWAAVPIAFAGCILASHFKEFLLVYYHYSGA
ncbi:MAG TPA: hypothetical protein VNF47_10635 [Streptosporangiaceae bacterium]|nr:hypothetical protein [Streptosporangiaceae bacterium]